ncbi:hypothetical protein DPQ33_11080 [Oceanidesulfovibrio indonesiensis]|jgi:hypothetical protein|uniref:Uncharacterized protein n=1 Tax=Oceanidesulfovibrio indonesiensis TaxID=54767 RepID=A0A7M3MER0_9BACT|nr:hypothetical protein [Oceanidesulfovibrio indonesiensis]TVM16938.1 hypothetical protein DPQ33_11080 [Oceanidesulfovibrio indonesiensis]
MDLDDLMSLRRYVSIAHHVPGRLRLKFDPAVRHDPRFDALRDAEAPFPGVLATRINTMARSMVIEYDSRIPRQDIAALFNGAEDAARDSFSRIADIVSAL